MSELNNENVSLKEWRNKWVSALRSGNYGQATNALKKHNNFCCLGVLCDISGEGTFGKRNSDAVADYFNSGDSSCSSFPPHKVCDLVGLSYSNAHIGHLDDIKDLLTPEELQLLHVYRKQSISLSLLNDAGFPFERIADIIEAAPGTLFK